MAIDSNHFMAQKLLSRSTIITAFCSLTNMPLLVCDPETYNDQIWVFENEELLKKFGAAYTQRKIPLKGVSMKKESFSGFFVFLYTIGVNEVAYMTEGSVSKIPLEELAKRPDLSKVPAAARPVENPELQLTGLYFLQEFGRPVPNEEKVNLAQLDEEFSINMVRARYVIPIDLKEGPGSLNEKISSRQYNVPILKLKNGDSLQPIFSDMVEFNKFRGQKKLNAITVPFAAIRQFLVKDAKGFILNPAGFHAVMPVKLLEALSEKFPEEAKQGLEEAKKIAQTVPKIQQMAAAKAANNHSKVTVMPGAGKKKT